MSAPRKPRPILPLTERDLDVLATLDFANYESRYPREYATPLDLGGHNGSHHSPTLAKLAKRGLVEVKRRGGWSRGSKCYRITAAGRALIASRRANAKLEREARS